MDWIDFFGDTYGYANTDKTISCDILLKSNRNFKTSILPIHNLPAVITD